MTAVDPDDDDLAYLGSAAPAGGDPAGPRAGDPGPQLMYPTAEAWVTDFLTVSYSRDVTEPGTHHHWCSQWWKHPEALDRLDALWRAWEALRRDPTTGPITWWIHYADPTMATLMSRDGPFGRCRRAEHTSADALVPPLPVMAAPDGVFLYDR